MGTLNRGVVLGVGVALAAALGTTACVQCQEDEVREGNACVRLCNVDAECGLDRRCEEGHCRDGARAQSDAGVVSTSSSLAGGSSLSTRSSTSTVSSNVSSASGPSSSATSASSAGGSSTSGGSTSTLSSGVDSSSLASSLGFTSSSAAPSSSLAGSSSSSGGFPMDWWDTGWMQRARIRLNHAYVRGDVQDVPLPVLLTDTQLPATAFLRGGADWRFVDDNGQVVPHDFEGTPTTDRMLAWVRVGLIPDRSSMAGMWLYFDNVGAFATEDPAAVWAGMASVLLGEGANATSVPDASGNNAPGARFVGTGAGTIARTNSAAMGFAVQLGSGGGVEVPALAARTVPASGMSMLLVSSSPGPVGAVFGPGSVVDSQFNLRRTASDTYVFGAGGTSVTFPNMTSYATTWNVAAVALDRTGSTNTLRFMFNEDAFAPVDMGTWLPAGQPYLFGTGLNTRLDLMMVADFVITPAYVQALAEAWSGVTVVVGERMPPPALPARTLARVAQPEVLYDFDDGAGNLARDTSGLAPALDLTVQDSSRVSWIPGGLRINQGTVLLGPVATRLTNACAASGNITVEAWVMPDHTSFTGPARILSVSVDTGYRNFSLVQGRDFGLRYRTDATNGNGTSTTDGTLTLLTTGTGSVDVTTMQHVVFTRDNGIMNAYLNGQPAGSRMWPGAPGPAWDETFAIMVGNEFDGGALNRSWLGTISLLAVWCRALDAAEVAQNYTAGP